MWTPIDFLASLPSTYPNPFTHNEKKKKKHQSEAKEIYENMSAHQNCLQIQMTYLLHKKWEEPEENK